MESLPLLSLASPRMQAMIRRRQQWLDLQGLGKQVILVKDHYSGKFVEFWCTDDNRREIFNYESDVSKPPPSESEEESADFDDK